MDSFVSFSYSWHVDDEGVLHNFGLTPDNKSVHIEIPDFTPYTYMELPTGIEWSDARRQAILSTIREFPSDIQPVTKSFMNKQRLYYANVVKNPKYEEELKEGKKTEKYKYKTFPYLFLAFQTKEAMMGFIKKMSYGTYIPSLGKKIRFKFHEQDASPVLQLTTCRSLPVTGWISGKGKPQMGIDKISTCNYEYRVSWKDLDTCKDSSIIQIVPCPRILMFDCEANSDNIATMPKNRPNDKIFQISLATMVHGTPKVDKHLLTLGHPDQKATGEDVIIHEYKTEGDLFVGFTELIHQIDPHIIGGYNILGWDFNYMIQRAKLNGVFSEFTKLGYLSGVQCKEKKISWSSSAFNSQNFIFLDIVGRLVIDMLPIVRRDFKMNKYDLGSVATEILGQTKDPLSHKGIFKCYRMFTPSSLALVGKYCVQDSNVTLMLFDKLKTWIGSCQLSATFRVPIIDLYTQGQQVKIYAQVYRDVLNKNFVVEKDGYTCAEDEAYTGAIVLDPIPGLYEDVITFDFASLYPSVIIAGNICYSTLATDPNIPDSDCNIFEWEDHMGCPHDKTKRTTKVKKVLCCKRRYRFLKSPIGVIPGILMNLLSERKKTKKEMEAVEGQAKEEKDQERKKALLMYATVLDMRQLALKISANSMYGGMGVRKGKLPFMPGAMCIDGDALISTGNGTTKRLNQLNNTKSLYAYKDGQVMSSGHGIIYKGECPTVQVTLLDGRKLTCTPDHRFMTLEGWAEASDLIGRVKQDDGQSFEISQSSKVMVGLELPEDISGEDEKSWSLLGRNMGSDRDWILTFARVLGYILADGSLSGDQNHCEGSVSVGTLMDATSFVRDINTLTGKTPSITSCVRENLKGSTYKIGIPVKLVRQFISIDGIQTGKRTVQVPQLPAFLFDNCPLSVTREFLGGLFGGDGISPSLSVSHPSFTPIGLDWQIIAQFKEEMASVMTSLCSLLAKFGIVFTPKTPSLARIDRFPPADHKENPRWSFGIVALTNASLLFAQKIGFRYSVNKNARLMVASSYQRFCDTAKAQRTSVVLKTSELFDIGNTTMKEALEAATSSVYLNESPVNAWCSFPSLTDIYRYRTQPHKLEGFKLLSKYFPTAAEYAETVGAKEWFDDRYAVNRDGYAIPCMKLSVIDVRHAGEKHVYDIIDVPEESFFANGMCVHNCTTSGGREALMKAKRIMGELFPHLDVYGDTDSLMVVLEKMERFHNAEGKVDYKLLEKEAHNISASVSKEFPPPMKMEFENISKKFFILTKKRYITELTNGKYKKRGVMVSRRDNAAACRAIYEFMLKGVFAGKTQIQMENDVIDMLNDMYAHRHPTRDYCITKSIKEIDQYKVKPPDKDPVKRAKQFANKMLDPKYHTDADYLIRALPAHVQLAERMRRRGQFVEAGSRLEFVTTTMGGPKAKMWQKIESADYYKDHSDIIRLEMNYYCKALVNPGDQVMEVMYKRKGFFKEQYALRQTKAKCLEELTELFNSIPVLVD